MKKSFELSKRSKSHSRIPSDPEGQLHEMSRVLAWHRAAERSRPGLQSLLKAVWSPRCRTLGWPTLNVLYQIYNLPEKLPCKNKI